MRTCQGVFGIILFRKRNFFCIQGKKTMKISQRGSKMYRERNEIGEKKVLKKLKLRFLRTRIFQSSSTVATPGTSDMKAITFS